MSFTASLNCCCWLASLSFWVFAVIAESNPFHFSSSLLMCMETSLSHPTHSWLSIKAVHKNGGKETRVRGKEEEEEGEGEGEGSEGRRVGGGEGGLLFISRWCALTYLVPWQQ